MARHLRRHDAKPILAFRCNQGDHGAACDAELAALGDTLVCHCGCHNRSCHPAVSIPCKKGN